MEGACGVEGVVGIWEEEGEEVWGEEGFALGVGWGWGWGGGAVRDWLCLVGYADMLGLVVDNVVMAGKDCLICLVLVSYGT